MLSEQERNELRQLGRERMDGFSSRHNLTIPNSLNDNRPHFNYLAELKKEADTIIISNCDYFANRTKSIHDFLYKTDQWGPHKTNIYFNKSFELNALIKKYEKDFNFTLEINNESMIQELNNSHKIKSIKLNKKQDNNQPINLNSILNKFTALKELSVFNRELTTPIAINELSSLEKISFNNTNIDYLPESIGGLSNLIELNLENNRLVSLPDEISNLKNLKKLNLANNKIRRLPESIGELTNLTTLNLKNNLLEYLPESIGNLKTYLINLDDNILYNIPKGVIILLNRYNDIKEALSKISIKNNPVIKKGYEAEILTTIDLMVNNNEISLSSHLKEFYEELSNKYHPTLHEKIIL